MRLFFAVLLSLLLAAALTAAMQYDPGYILLAWGQTTVEMTLWVGIAVLALLLALLALAFIALRRGARFGDRLGSLRSMRRHRRDRDKTHRGLVAYIEGNWSQSRRLLIDAARESERPLINYLLAARASHRLGDINARREYLGLAESTGDGADIAVAVAQAEMQLESGQLEEALATLTRLKKSARHPAVLQLLQQVYAGLEDWSALRGLIPELRSHGFFEAQQVTQLEGRALNGELQRLRNAGDIAAVQQWWRHLPQRWAHDRGLLLGYLGALRSAGQDGDAMKLIQQSLAAQWDNALLDDYGQLLQCDAKKQLKIAEGWRAAHGEDPALLLCLGRLSLRNELWGKARDYFESAHRLGAGVAVCLELARLHDALGEHDLARSYSREATTLMGQGLPALPQPKVPAQASAE